MVFCFKVLFSVQLDQIQNDLIGFLWLNKLETMWSFLHSILEPYSIISFYISFMSFSLRAIRIGRFTVHIITNNNPVRVFQWEIIGEQRTILSHVALRSVSLQIFPL